jgi:uncharacterized protein (TIGR00106 family)
MLAEFSIYPLGGTRHLSKEIARVVETLGDTGLHFELGPLSTAIEGDWDQVLKAIRLCHEKMVEEHDRVITTITIDQCKSGQHRLAEMVESVKRQLPARERAGAIEF